MFRRLLQGKSPSAEPRLLGDRKIHLHLGAHKTATTFLQKTLARNRELLLENGVLYLPLAETRKKVSKHLLAISAEDRDPSSLALHRERLLKGLDPEKLEHCHTVFISDENLIGSASRIHGGSTYQGIVSKFRHVHAELGPDITVSFSIRDYPGFYTSLYSEILRKNRYFPFRKMHKIFGEVPRLWTDVQQDLTTAFGAENVLLWDFRDTIAKPAEVLAMLTGLQVPFAIEALPVRESLSRKAIEFIRDFQKLPGKRLPPEIICQVANRLYPLSAHPEKFDPWGPGEREALLKIYQEEKGRLPVRAL